MEMILSARAGFLLAASGKEGGQTLTNLAMKYG